MLSTLACGLAFLAPGSAFAADAYPGTYSGSARGVDVKLDVGTSGAATLRYTLKTSCGRTRGRIELSKAGTRLAGKRLSRGPRASLRTIKVKLQPQANAAKLAGVLKDSLRGGNRGGCDAKRNFVMALEKSDAFLPARNVGHYSGTGGGGLPIAFDVVEDGREARIENLVVDVDAECFDEDEGLEFAVVAHLPPLEATVAPDGGVYIEHTPDRDTQYLVEGRLAGGSARLDIEILGSFDHQGVPASPGPVSCDSWGAIYTAARAR